MQVCLHSSEPSAATASSAVCRRLCLSGDQARVLRRERPQTAGASLPLLSDRPEFVGFGHEQSLPPATSIVVVHAG